VIPCIRNSSEALFECYNDTKENLRVDEVGQEILRLGINFITMWADELIYFV
jgi:hypothetical protein